MIAPIANPRPHYTFEKRSGTARDLQNLLKTYGLCLGVDYSFLYPPGSIRVVFLTPPASHVNWIHVELEWILTH